jgi:hypothetical protein
MILSLTLLFGLIAALFFLPIQVFLLTAVYCYAMLNLWRIYSNSLAVLDMVVLVIYSVIGVLYYFFGFKDIVPFTGSIFYGAIGMAALVGGLIGRPFTLREIREKPKPEITFHRVMNIMLGISYMGALYFSIALFPGSAYITVPLAISIVAIPLSMVGAKKGIWVVARYSEIRIQKNNKNI